MDADRYQFTAAHGEAVLRVASLPTETLTELSGATLEEIEFYLRSCYLDPFISEAIYIASTSLHTRLKQWASGNRKYEDARTAFARYMRRMSFRSTPFGLFASCGPISLTADQSQLKLPDLINLRRDVRLDSHVHQLCKEISRLLSNDEVLSVNGSLRKLGATVRWIGYDAQANGKRIYTLLDAEVDDELSFVLKACEPRVTRSALEQKLSGQFGGSSTSGEIREFIDSLIESQLLVGQCQPPLTMGDLGKYAIKWAAGLRHVEPRLEAVSSLSAIVEELESDGPGVESQKYETLLQKLSEAGAPSSSANPLQVDLYIPDDNGIAISQQLRSRMESAIDALSDLTGEPLWSLALFASKFSEIYGEGEIPLTDLVDNNNAALFLPWTSASPLISGLDFTGARSDVRVVLERIASELAADRQVTPTELYIDIPVDGSRTRDSRSKGSVGTHALASFSLWTSDKIGNEPVLEVSSFTMQDPERIFGRFTCGSNRIAGIVDDLRRQAAALKLGHIQAEIIHLPEDKLGSLVARRVHTTFEIPIVAATGVGATPISLSDIMVSVSAGAVMLRSASLNKLLDVRMANAHAFDNAKWLSAYRFLCAVSSQRSARGEVTLRNFVGNAPFCPGLLSKKTIFSRPTWCLERLVRSAKWRGANPGEKRLIIRNFAEDFNAPRWVRYIDGENSLPFDLSSDWMLDEFITHVERRPNTLFSDVYPMGMRPAMRSGAKSHHHEIFVPLINNDYVRASYSYPRAAASRKGIGSDWLYVKIYCDGRSQNKVVCSLNDLLATASPGVLRGWFFVRYYDGSGPHLRVRAQAVDASAAARLYVQICKGFSKLMDESAVVDIQSHTYVREVVRYGGEQGIDICESMFFDDTIAAVELVKAADRFDSWEIGLFIVDSALGALGVHSIGEKLQFAKRASRDFDREFGFGSASRKRIGAIYKSLHPARPRDATSAYGRAYSFCDAKLAKSWKELVAVIEGGANIYDLRWSLIHMRLNRVLDTEPRKHEAVLWELLRRRYQEHAARHSSVTGDSGAQ